mmetsp:Transcript_27169/g.68614  ORF Transcript_27169/g.68614 Transcript_27169/m.68614 type:complete len:100 (-) Transcript_27169:225-524(-)
MHAPRPVLMITYNTPDKPAPLPPCARSSNGPPRNPLARYLGTMIAASSRATKMARASKLASKSTRPSNKHCTRQTNGKLPSQIEDARETFHQHLRQKHT